MKKSEMRKKKKKEKKLKQKIFRTQKSQDSINVSVR